LAIPLGLLLLVAALIVWAILDPEHALKSLPVVIPAAAGAVLFVLGCALSASWLASVFFQKRAAVGANVAFMIFLFVLVVLILNVISVRRYVRWDWTEEGMFTLASQTKNILNGLDEKKVPLKVTTLLGSSGQATRILRLVREFARQAKCIELREIDLYRNKAEMDLFIQSLKEKPSTESVVLQYGDPEKAPELYREKIIALQDFLEYPPMNYMMMMRGQQPEPRFKGEETLSSALLEIADPKKPKVYFTKGHGELDTESFREDGLAELVKLLKRGNYEVETVDLLQTGEVPDDCAVLVIASPEKPFEDKEIQSLRAYLQREEPRAGKLMLMTKPIAAGGAIAGLRELLQEYNVRVRDNLLVVQEAMDLFSGRRVAQLSVSVSDWGKHTITKDLQNERGTFYLACPVQADMPAPPQGYGRQPQEQPWLVTPIATCGRSTWGETSTPKGGRITAEYDPHEEERGPFTLAVAVESQPRQPGMPPDPTPGSGARLVVIGDATSAVNAYISGARQANQGFILGAINWLAEREYGVGIPPKLFKRRPLTVTPVAGKTVRAVCWFGLPVLVILVGGIVLWWRRH